MLSFNSFSLRTTYQNGCESKGLEVSKGVLNEFNSRIAKCGTGNDKAKLNFSNCSLNDEHVRLSYSNICKITIIIILIVIIIILIVIIINKYNLVAYLFKYLLILDLKNKLYYIFLSIDFEYLIFLWFIIY